MVKQQQLVETAVERRITPAEGRKAPVTWVRELRVLTDLGSDRQYVKRRIKLRRGMNILWAKASSGQRQKLLFEDSLSGHSAGKTTFCRFLRYALGEPHFGDELLRREIREAFPNGWVVAQVFVADESWIVCRPLGIGAHPFVVRAASIESALEPDATRETIDDYLAALNASVFAAVPVKQSLGSGENLGWGHLLPWLARDQECHFDGLVDWRDSESDSDSPQLDLSDRQLLLRGLLGLIDDEEDRERRANEKRVTKRKKVRARRPKLIHQANVDRRRLETVLGKQLPPFDDGLFHDSVKCEIDEYERERHEEIRAGGAESSDDKLAELESALETAIKQEADAVAQVKDVEQRLEQQRDVLKGLRGDATQSKRDAFLDDLKPSSRFCNVPIELAIESGCPLAAGQPIRFADRVGEMSLDEQADRQEQLIAKLDELLNERRRTVVPFRADTRKARKALAEARKLRDERVGHEADLNAHIKYLRQLAENAESAWKESEECEAMDDQFRGTIERSYKKQERIREERADDMRTFSGIFDHFISALLGDSVEGRAAFSGREIDLRVFHRGERRSSAIKIVKNIAFDLAAMTSSIEGRGHHPRLLIHDGPRESDMSADLYRKVFLLVQMLEGSSPQGHEPSFQYIITTTEPPPKDLQQKPWLIQPVLDASNPAKRFLGVDL